MIKNIKKIVALLMAAALMMGFCACHKAGETAVTVDGIKFTSGFYACAFLQADSEAMEKVVAENPAIQQDGTNKAFLDKKIEGKTYSDWVKARAIEICKEFVAARRLCEENNVDTATAIANAKLNAEYYWSAGYEASYTANGVGFDSFKEFMSYSVYQSAYFDALYGEKGKTPLTDDEIAKHLRENYAYVNILSSEITDLSEEDLATLNNTFEDYKTRIKGGEPFAKIYAEANGTEYAADETDFGAFSNTLAAVWSAEGTQYENDHFADISKVKEGEVELIDIADSDGCKYRYLVLRADIMNEKNTNLETLKAAAKTDLKGDEVIKAIEERAAKLTANEAKSSTAQFKVNKIDYLED